MSKLKKAIVIIIAFIAIGKIFYKDHIRPHLLNFCQNSSLTPILLKYLPFEAQRKNTRPEYVLALYQILKDVHDVLGALKFSYSIDGGTLLGAVRHKGIIPWDGDTDIVMFLKDRPRFIKKAIPVLESLGYEIAQKHNLIKITANASLFKIRDGEERPTCDIFFLVEDGDFFKIPEEDLVWPK